MGSWEQSIPDSVRAFVARVHVSQTYNGGPYTKHLEQVVDIVHPITQEYDIILAAYLHDVLEDGRAAGVTADGLLNLPGVTTRAVALVQAVTRGPGSRRKTIPAALQATRVAGSDATLIKLADRIANVESCWANLDTRLFMYWREYGEFRNVLRVESDERLRPLWDWLDRALGWRTE